MKMWCYSHHSFKIIDRNHFLWYNFYVNSLHNVDYVAFFMSVYRQGPNVPFVFDAHHHFQWYKALWCLYLNVRECLQGGQYLFAESNRFLRINVAGYEEIPFLLIHQHFRISLSLISIFRVCQGGYRFLLRTRSLW